MLTPRRLMRSTAPGLNPSLIVRRPKLLPLRRGSGKRFGPTLTPAIFDPHYRLGPGPSLFVRRPELLPLRRGDGGADRAELDRFIGAFYTEKTGCVS
jgi:hypothetical protein